MDYRKALPSYNKRNNYVLYLLLKILQIKTIRKYSCLISKIINIFSTQVYIFNENITLIRDGQFREHNNLREVVIPKSVTSIEGGAFKYCISLEEIIIPNSVTSIDGYAFDACVSLKEVIIPNSVTRIGNNAFRDTKIIKTK